MSFLYLLILVEKFLWLLVRLHSFHDFDRFPLNKVVEAVTNYQAQNASRERYNRDTEQDKD